MVLFSHIFDETHMNFTVLPNLQIDIEGRSHIDKLFTTNKSLKKFLVQRQSCGLLSDRFLKEETLLLDKNSFEKPANRMLVELSNISSTTSLRKVLLSSD